MKFFLGCAELSGQQLMKAYLKEIIEADPAADLTVQASVELEQEFPKINRLFDSSLCQVMGFIEPLKRLPSLLYRRRAIKEWLRVHRPKIMITFDAPDFFLPIAAYARQLGIYCIHVVAPSVWAWRSGRTKILEKSADELHVLYAFEEQLFKKNSFKTKFIGHPLLKAINCQERHTPVNRLLLAPGSRTQEIKAHLAIFLEWAGILKQEGIIKEACLAIAPGQKSLYQQYDIPGWIEQKTLYEGLERSDFAIVCSGTATLEVVSQGCPAVIVYDIPEWKLWFLRLFVHTPYIGLPNILTQKQLVPEYVGPLSQKKDAVLSHIRVLCTEPAYHTLATNIAETMRSLLEENMKPCLKDIWKTTLSQALMKQVEVV